MFAYSTLCWGIGCTTTANVVLECVNGRIDSMVVCEPMMERHAGTADAPAPLGVKGWNSLCASGGCECVVFFGNLSTSGIFGTSVARVGAAGVRAVMSVLTRS